MKYCAQQLAMPAMPLLVLFRSNKLTNGSCPTELQIFRFQLRIQCIRTIICSTVKSSPCACTFLSAECHMCHRVSHHLGHLGIRAYDDFFHFISFHIISYHFISFHIISYHFILHSNWFSNSMQSVRCKLHVYSSSPT